MIPERAKCNKNATAKTSLFSAEKALFFKETKGRKEGQKSLGPSVALSFGPVALALRANLGPSVWPCGPRCFRATFSTFFEHLAQVGPRSGPVGPYWAPWPFGPLPCFACARAPKMPGFLEF